MLTIRLQRTGKKNQADFRIVLAEKEAPVQKKFVEILGSYNPRKKAFQVKEERVKYWITQRVELSETIHNLFVTKGLLNEAKVKAFTIPKKPPEKSEEKPAEGAAAPAAEATSESAEAPVAAEVPTEIPATPEVKAEIRAEEAKVEAKAEEAPAATEEKAA